MGRHKVPTKIKKLRGTDREDRDPPSQIRLEQEEGIPAPPVEMGGHGKVLWEQVTTALWQLGMLAKVSTVQIEQYCNNYEIYKQAWRQTEYGTVLTSGTRKHPAFSIMMEAQKAMRSFEDRYGLNPSYASKIKAPAKEESKTKPAYDEFEDV